MTNPDWEQSEASLRSARRHGLMHHGFDLDDNDQLVYLHSRKPVMPQRRPVATGRTQAGGIVGTHTGARAGVVR